ncbi:hypothetical protein WCLP8_3230014 [uncultured Gammaproteobacteria bacterium]
MDSAQTVSGGTKKGFRTLVFVALVVVASIWNSTVYGLFGLLGSPDGLLGTIVAALMMPLAAIGIALLGAAAYIGVPLLNPRVTLTAGPAPGHAGDLIQVSWTLEGSVDRIPRLSIVAEGVEEVSGGWRTLRHVFRRQQVFQTTEPSRIRSGSTTIEIPKNAIPSFLGRSHRLAWVIRLQCGSAHWPNVCQEIDFPVVP